MSSLVSAVLPAYNRPEQTWETVEKLQACEPPPDEIIVYLDGGADMSLPEGVKVLREREHLGPGGGRNLLLKAAKNDLVASFDDDSWPIDENYFSRIKSVATEYPSAALFAAEIHEKNKDAPQFRRDSACEVVDFVGCGCVYRKSALEGLRGYLPLQFAYGCEESDLSLQLFAAEKVILFHPSLRVFHNTEMSHHSSANVNAASLGNLALLAWLHYPLRSLVLGMLQVFSRLCFLFKKRRFRGLGRGVWLALQLPLQWRSHRSPLSAERFSLFRQCKK